MNKNDQLGMSLQHVGPIGTGNDCRVVTCHPRILLGTVFFFTPQFPLPMNYVEAWLSYSIQQMQILRVVMLSLNCQCHFRPGSAQFHSTFLEA